MKKENRREIKFRVWDKIDKKICDISVFNDPYSILANNYERWIPLQYTGLKDKNGKEIYEGDIVKNETNIAEVKWDLEGGCWILFGSYNKLNIGKWSDYGVIGNIYENPELLNQS